MSDADAQDGLGVPRIPWEETPARFGFLDGAVRTIIELGRRPGLMFAGLPSGELREPLGFYMLATTAVPHRRPLRRAQRRSKLLIAPPEPGRFTS